MKHWTKFKRTKNPEVIPLDVNSPPAVKVEDHIFTGTNTCMYLGSKKKQRMVEERLISDRDYPRQELHLTTYKLFGYQVNTPLEQTEVSK